MAAAASGGPPLSARGGAGQQPARKSVLIGVRPNGGGAGGASPGLSPAHGTAVTGPGPAHRRNGSSGATDSAVVVVTGPGAAYAAPPPHVPQLNVPSGGGGGSGGRRTPNAHVPVQVRTGRGVILRRVVPAARDWSCLELYRSLGIPSPATHVPRIAVRTRNGAASLMEPHESVALAITYPQCTQLEFDLPPGLGLSVVPPGTGPQSPVGAEVSTADGGVVGPSGALQHPHGAHAGAAGAATDSAPAHPFLTDIDASHGVPHLTQQGGTPWEQFARSLRAGPHRDTRWLVALAAVAVAAVLLVVWIGVVFAAFGSKSDHCATFGDEPGCRADAVCEWYAADARAPRGFDGPSSGAGCGLRFSNAQVMGTAFPGLITLGLSGLCLLWFCTSGQRAGFPVTCFACCLATSTVLWAVALVLSVALRQDLVPLGLSVVVLVFVAAPAVVAIRRVRACRAVREDGAFPEACDC